MSGSTPVCLELVWWPESYLARPAETSLLRRVLALNHRAAAALERAGIDQIRWNPESVGGWDSLNGEILEALRSSRQRAPGLLDDWRNLIASEINREWLQCKLLRRALAGHSAAECNLYLGGAEDCLRGMDTLAAAIMQERGVSLRVRR